MKLWSNCRPLKVVPRTRNILRRERDTCRDELLQLAAGATLDDFVAEAASIATDALPGELRRIEEAIADLERTRGEQNEIKGSTRRSSRAWTAAPRRPRPPRTLRK